MFGNSSYIRRPGGGGSPKPGSTAKFPANTIPYVDGSNQYATDGLFTYQSGNLGVGTVPSLGVRVHIKGTNDSTGSALKVQSATYEIINVYNNRQVVIGGGSAATTTTLTVKPGGVGVETTDFNLKVIGSGNDNLLYVSNGSGYTNGGVYIYRNANTGRYALTVGSTQSGSGAFYVNSAGVIGFSNTYSPIGQFDMPLSIGMSSSTSYKGALFALWNDNASGFHFTKTGYSTIPFFNISHIWALANTSATAVNLSITPTVNFTGTGTHNIVGIKYSPTLTAITGANYGLLMESGLNGFGLGATLPTAVIDIAASTTATSSFRIRSGTAPTSPNDGDIWFDGTNLKIRVGGVTKTFTII